MEIVGPMYVAIDWVSSYFVIQKKKKNSDLCVFLVVAVPYHLCVALAFPFSFPTTQQ
jgi:hypothetical protein